MRNFARWLLASLLVVAAVGVGVGCGSDDDDSGGGGASASKSEPSSGGKKIEKKTIGVVDTLYAASAQKRCFEAMKAAADKVGWEVKLTDSEGDPGKALTAAQNYVTQKVDALVLSSTPQAWVVPALKQAEAAKIPTLVICGGIGEDDTEYDARYTEDETKLGEAMAEPIIEDLTEAGGGSVLVIGDKAVDAGVKREAAFRDKLKAVPDAKIVAAPTADLKDPVQSTQKRVADALTANKDLSSIFVVYDWMIPPTLTALRDAGLDTKVKVYGPYADAANLPFLRDPKSPVAAVAEAPLAQTGIVAIDQLLAHFVDGKELDKAAFDATANDLANYKPIRNGSPDIPEKATGDALDDYQMANIDQLLEPYVKQWQSKYGL